MKESCINVKKASLLKLGYTDLQDWLKNKNHIYCGRDMSLYVPGAKESKWKNPFRSKNYGLEKCLQLFEKHIRESELINDLPELKGKTLGCWCIQQGKHQTDKDPFVCHTQVLLKLLHEHENKKNKSKYKIDINDFPPLS